MLLSLSDGQKWLCPKCSDQKEPAKGENQLQVKCKKSFKQEAKTSSPPPSFDTPIRKVNLLKQDSLSPAEEDQAKEFPFGQLLTEQEQCCETYQSNHADAANGNKNSIVDDKDLLDDDTKHLLDEDLHSATNEQSLELHITLDCET